MSQYVVVGVNVIAGAIHSHLAAHEWGILPTPPTWNEHPWSCQDLRSFNRRFTINDMDFVDSEEIRQLILLAKREDVGSGDLSCGLLPNPQEPAVFSLLAKQAGVVAGRAMVKPTLREYDPPNRHARARHRNARARRESVGALLV